MGVCNAIALPAQHGQVTAADAKTESRGGPGIDFQTDVPGKTQDLGFADEVEIVAQTGSYLDGERAVSFSHDPCRGLQPVRRQGMPRQPPTGNRLLQDCSRSGVRRKTMQHGAQAGGIAADSEGYAAEAANGVSACYASRSGVPGPQESIAGSGAARQAEV